MSLSFRRVLLVAAACVLLVSAVAGVRSASDLFNPPPPRCDGRPMSTDEMCGSVVSITTLAKGTTYSEMLLGDQLLRGTIVIVSIVLGTTSLAALVVLGRRWDWGREDGS